MLGSLRFLPAALEATSAEPIAGDDPLVARARNDPSAFAPLYDRYADPIYRYCYRRLGDPDLAADAMSQVFAKAMTALHRYRGGSFRAWLFTIAHNVAVDVARTRWASFPLDTAAAIADPAPTPEQHSLAAEQRRTLLVALAQLPDNQRRIVELRLAGLTTPEIAASLGQTLPAVKSAQTRAFARLRRFYTEQTDLEERRHAD